ncbi:MAG: hypothetical protein QOI27_523 [Gaiellaceae bacterium]|jgi:hypothetical protein|nr:hypothetical protein [Gaiellaceae bacterium]MEA2282640.1 hypothetical protein [Solirubrobacteraceae bacterium]
MSTETPFNLDIEDLFDVHAFAARCSASQRDAADRLLDLYQDAVVRLADAHVSRARAVEIPAVVAVAETQAALSRDVADAYVRSVRKLLEH